jgi:hypothetical protein
MFWVWKEIMIGALGIKPISSSLQHVKCGFTTYRVLEFLALNFQVSGLVI